MLMAHRRMTRPITPLAMSEFDRASLNGFAHENGNKMFVPKASSEGVWRSHHFVTSDLRDKSIALFAETLGAMALLVSKLHGREN